MQKETKGNELVTISTFLMRKHMLFHDLMIDPYTYSNYMKAIQNGYQNVQYHNKTHGIDVC